MTSGRLHALPSGEVAILLAAVAYGISTTSSVAALDVLRPADLVVLELSGAALVLFTVAIAAGKVSLDGAGRNFALGALMPGLAFVLGDLGLSRTSASAGSLLYATDVPLSVLFSALVLHEMLRGRAMAALVIGLSGSAIVALGNGGGGESTTLGNLLVLASVGAGASFVVVTRKHNADDGLNASAWQTLGGAVCTSPFVAFGWWHSGSNLGVAGWQGWGFGLAVLAFTAVGGVAFNWGISSVPGVRASQLLNLAPVVGLGSAIVVLSERPSSWQCVGGAVIIVALVVLVRAVEGGEDPEPELEPAIPAASVEARRPAAMTPSDPTSVANI